MRILIILFMLFATPCFGAEVISEFSAETLPTLNDELRDTGRRLNDLDGDVVILTASIDAINSVPSGVILMWSGAISAIPTGWVICDGTNSTPDLTDRFVIHADADAAGTNDVGDTGGVSSVTLTSAESGVPAHTHSVLNYTELHGSGAVSTKGSVLEGGSTTITANTAANAASAHTNRDKFYALAFIMKT